MLLNCNLRQKLSNTNALQLTGVTDHPERTKSDHLQSSQGPLSSIKAAIKRTRTNSQSDHTRDRRRPEITIVSAEPLGGNNWFPGTPVVFSSPPPPPLPQPPPSYEQVIKEKTQEEHTPQPTAAPRRGNDTATSSTQTDPVKEDAAIPQCSAARQSAGNKPQKPPRPSLPKSVNRKLSTGTAGPADEEVVTNTSTSTNPENQDDSNSHIKPPQQADSSNSSTRSVTVHWDIHTKNTEKVSGTAAPSSESELNLRPVPLPRTKSRKQAIAKEAEDDTLVKLGENSDAPSDFDPEDVSPNKYLKELLEVFSAENESKENCDVVNQSNETTQGEDADGKMSHSQRSIRARIQAFESQADTEERYVAAPVRPEPQPRKTTTKPPVSAKPSVAVKPQLNYSTDNVYENPTPAARPQPPPKKPVVGQSVKEELDALLTKGPVPNRSRPALTRASSIYEEVEPSPTPPIPPVKPIKEPLKTNLNINNHNSTSVIGQYENVEKLSNQVSVKAQSNVDGNGGSFTRQSMTRRPTTIRVPSKTGSFSDGFQDSPPPLPAQKPVGSLNPSLNQQQNSTSIFPSQESFYAGPEPSLPPRRLSTAKSLPPRPPPAKPGPGRPPPPRVHVSGQSTSVTWETSPKPQAQKPHRTRPVLPPRPNPGHRLYNKYTLQLPHGIASFDYNGNNTGELSFQKNEVLLLLKEIDYNTFECQVGDTQGRVNKSRMKVITPLSSFSDVSPSQSVKPARSDGRDSNGLKVKALHDFDPEGPGELALRAGDVVSMVEQVDNEWYKGTCRGSTGYFPINYVQVLSDSPKPLPERKGKTPSATVSGPRCVARFDFEGEHDDELSFSEGDVIQLKAYMGQDWARGQIGSSTGIFPLNFVEVVEDLPPPPSQQQKQSTKRALPGMAASPFAHPEVAKPAQAPQSGLEWVVALYDFSGYSEGDLSFEQGDCILVTEHVNAEWSYGRLNGREGMFPRAFVESRTASAGLQSSDVQENGAAGGMKARALFDFASDCDEELSLQVGDIVTNLESIDEEWFLGDLSGKRALVPKNYVQVI
ncbi:SH3 domain-containing protein 19 isoform X1 [Sphaeramia orbicularis]|uniref:SH3 domain-containing protein 19 isoform X1 n=1 Tax=Sphaeramia orbicularis TaxID=375764 RepID=UPI0011811ED0|nr:SH3 domain-containing protein 19 isoform X1 [Sphaeramia orbicularis]